MQSVLRAGHPSALPRGPRRPCRPAPAPRPGLRRRHVIAASSQADGDDGWQPHAARPQLLEQVSALVQRWLRPLWTLGDWVTGLTRSVAARALLVLLGLLLGAKAALQLVVVPLINTSVLPQISEAAERVLMRQVRVGALSEVPLGGLVGTAPLVVARDIYLGPGLVEHSSCRVEVAELRLLPLVSLAQQQLVLALHLRRPEATLVQGANLSWLGYPADTIPSSRDFLPGLQQQQPAAPPEQQQQAEEEEGEETGSGTPVAALELVDSSGPAPVEEQPLSTASDGWRPLQGAQQLLGSLQQAALQRLMAAVQHPLEAAASSLVSQLHLGRVSLDCGSAAVYITGELMPRQVSNLELVAVLGPGYRTLDLSIEADAARRHPGSAKVTLVSPTARRHLRHVTPGAARHPQDKEFTCDVLREPAEQDVVSCTSPAGVTAPDKAAPDAAAAAPPPPGDQAADSSSSSSSGSQTGAAASHSEVLQVQGVSQEAQQEVDTQSTASPSHTALGGEVPRPLAAAAAEACPSGPVCVRLGGNQVPATLHYQTNPLQPPASSTSLEPTGGHFSVRITNTWPAQEGQHGVLDVRVRGTRVHAPLLERLLEIPLDISEGEVTEGELRVVADDAASWQFPRIYGKLVVRGASIHIWDATDDLLGVDMDLVFDKDRVYLHNATAHFGAIPLCVSGDMDLDPARGGQYRLQATVPGVEMNAARASLGVNPLPIPVAGALRGVLHATGPLEHPIFSGSLSAVRPAPDMLEGGEDTPALRALLADPTAVAAYDRVAGSAVTAVFTLDTSTEMLVVHSAQAVPAGGGMLGATAKIWVAPAAEADPRALVLEVVGQGLAPAQLAANYVVQGGGPAAAPSILAGTCPLNVRVRLEGSHLSPTTTVHWAAPGVGASGSAVLTPSSIALNSGGEVWRASAALDITTPGADKARAAVTQTEATYWGTPRVEGFQLDASCAALDLLPLMAPAPPADTAPNSSSTAIAATSSSTPAAGTSSSSSSGGGLLPAGAAPRRLRATGQLSARGTRDTSLAARRQQAVLTSPDGGGSSGFLFTGNLQLQGLQLNQCRLCRRLTGDLVLTPVRVLLRATGATPREALSADLALPPDMLQPPVQPDEHGNIQPLIYRSAAISSANSDSRQQLEEAGEGASLEGETWATGSSASSSSSSISQRGGEGSQEVSNLLLRRDDLYFSSTVNRDGSVCGAVVENLLLDDLELGTLRGKLLAAQFDLDLEARHGRGALVLEGPRLLGLRGKRLEAAARWEQEVVLLERCALSQQASTYQLSGEYVLPPGLPLPTRLLPEPSAGGPPQAPALPEDTSQGRWRLQVDVPSASVEELLPVGAVLQAASQASAGDATAAKASFLSTLHRLAAAASPEDFRPHVAALLEAATQDNSKAAKAANNSGNSSSSSSGAPGPGQEGAARRLPGLHELRGAWSGSLTAVGGGGLEPRCDLHLEGTSWCWGPYRMDQALVRGTASAGEGLALEQLLVVLGEARVEAKGALLGPQQDASLVVTDFPAMLLQPMYSALPALQHAAPAAGAGGRKPRGSGWPLSLGDFLPAGAGGAGGGGLLGGVAGQLEAALVAMGVMSPSSRELDPWEPFLGSPVSGLINVSAKLGGSAATPSGSLQVSLVQGALGATRLASAAAKARLEGGTKLQLTLDAAPAAHKGKLHAHGSLQLPSPAPPPEAARHSSRGSKKRQQAAQVASPGSLDVSLQVEDGGMALLAGLVPGLSWEGGGASILLRAQGPLTAPAVTGAATLHRAAMSCAWLRHPISAASCSLTLGDQLLMVSQLEAKVGPRGSVKAAGALPLTPTPGNGQQQQPQPASGLTLSCADVELRLRNMYSGLLSAQLTVKGSAAAPEVGGCLGLSKGTIFLLPPAGGPGAGPDAGGAAAAAAQAAQAAATAAAGGGGRQLLEVSDADLVAQAFSALKAGGVRRAVAAAAAGAHQLPAQGLLSPELPQGVGPAPSPGPAPPAELRLAGLVLELGPELRAVFPVVLNVGLSGSLVLDGFPSAPGGLVPLGVLRLEGGSLNLVATQFRLDREAPATITFTQESGPDPLLDLTLVSSELRATLAGRASAWKEHLTLSVLAPAPGAGSSSSSSGQAGGEASAAWQMAEVARLWEGRLADSLGRGGAGLSLTTLASNTVSSLLPKLETQGQLGGARWRLVSAPSLPGLLSSDPSGRSGAPQLLRSLVLGTEVELSLGQRLVAALSHGASSSRGEAADAGTEVRLAVALSRQLRLLMQLRGMALAPTVFLQYSSDGSMAGKLA